MVATKNKPNERKRSDMTGSQWSKDELRRFYQAYSKYGKDWKKVAKISGKPPDIVEALYKMNKVFLTLSEGKATEAGFIARMTDHCNRPDGSCSKKAMDQVVKTSHKIQKYGYEKLQINIKKGSHGHNRPHLQTKSAKFHSAQLDPLQLELSKDLFDGSQQPHIVRKRTPRFPVSPSLDKNDGTSISRNKDSAKQGHDVDNSKVEFEKNVEDGKSLGHVQHSESTGKFFTEVEEYFLYALQHLVDSSLRDDKFVVNDKSKILVEKEREYFSIDRAQVATGEDTKVEKVLNPNACTSSETKKTEKSKVLAENFQRASTSSEPCLSEIGKQALFVEGDSSNGNYLALRHEQGNNIHTPECSFLNTDLGRSVANSSESTPPAPSVSHQNMATRNRARWKTSLQKQMKKYLRIPSSYMLRRWCAFEWFYSAIDYAWFAEKKFAEHVNDLGITRKLTRTEWSIIRSSLGKPRRLSVKFLSQERRNLGKYRESVRAHYAEQFVDAKDDFPKDKAQSLSVNQLVRVRHHRTGEIFNGKILYVGREKYKVQFDSPDFEEVVMDIDCMPVNCSDNLPEDHREQTTRNRLCNELEMDHNAKSCSNRSSDIADGISLPEGDCGNANLRDNDASKQAMSSQSYSWAQLRERKAAIAKSNQSLKEKENLVSEGEQNDENVGGDSENSREQDGIVKIPSHEDSDEVHSPVQNIMTNVLSNAESSSGFQMSNNSGLTRSDIYDYYGLTSHATEIVGKSILEARGMVDLTIMQESNPQNEAETTDVASSEADYLSELISACVSTSSIIKDLSERRFPPAMVMQILDHALHKLQPLSSRNLSIYLEIEKYMGIIKSQMLALLPTNVSL